MSKASLLLILITVLLINASLACRSETSAEKSALSRLVKLDLEAPSNAKAGEMITLKLHLQNVTNEKITLYTGEHRFDFVVTDDNGVEVWQRWPGGQVEDIMLLLPLEPKQIRDYTLQWDQHANNCPPSSTRRNCPGGPVPPGTYSVRGILTAHITENSPEETVETETQKLTIRT